MYSSIEPGTVGTSSEPLQYGLRAMMYQVRHLGIPRNGEYGGS
jgi:hypothetical protein